MFQAISAIVLIASVGAIFAHRAIVRRTETMDAVQQGPWLRIIRPFAWFILAASIVLLGAIGFLEATIEGEKVHGFLLMVHVTFGGVFAFMMAVVALLEGNRYTFDPGDFSPGRRSVGCRKIAFWAVVALTIPVTLSMVLSMTPLWGTAGQQFLYELHRYSTLSFAVAALWLAYLALRTRPSHAG